MINCMGSDKILKGKGGATGKWIKYSQNLKNRKCLTVCINRKGYNENAYNLYLKDVKNGLVDPEAFMFIDVNVEPLSSTLVRNVLKKYQNEINEMDANHHQQIIEKYRTKLKIYMNDQCADYL